MKHRVKKEKKSKKEYKIFIGREKVKKAHEGTQFKTAKEFIDKAILTIIKTKTNHPNCNIVISINASHEKILDFIYDNMDLSIELRRTKHPRYKIVKQKVGIIKKEQKMIEYLGFWFALSIFLIRPTKF